MPLVSILVSAYNRKDMIIGALQSIKSQTVGRDQYEVIVMVNFDDPALRSFCSENKYRLVLYHDAGIGQYIVRFAELAQAPVLAFLDDDDRWHPYRLEHLIKAWDDGTVLAKCLIDSTPFNLIGMQENCSSITTLPQDPVRLMRQCETHAMYFNISSIAVKRDAVLHSRDTLTRVIKLSDTPIFLTGILYGGTVKYIRDVDVFYHEHPWDRVRSIDCHHDNWILLDWIVRLHDSPLREELIRFISHRGLETP